MSFHLSIRLNSLTFRLDGPVSCRRLSVSTIDTRWPADNSRSFYSLRGNKLLFGFVRHSARWLEIASKRRSEKTGGYNGQYIHRNVFVYLSTTLMMVVARPTEVCGRVLTHFARSSKIGTVTTGFDSRLANRPLLVLTFGHFGDQPWAPECPKVKTKNGRLASRRWIPELISLF